MAIDEKPSRNEDEYFAKVNAELLQKRRAQLDAERANQDRKAISGKCPRDGTPLEEKEMEQVKIDFCPQCRGIWLDAGELEMLRDSRKSGLDRFINNIWDVKR